MDNNKHNDWTGAVRERLEGRELTPSDALWERIGAAALSASQDDLWPQLVDGLKL